MFAPLLAFALLASVQDAAAPATADRYESAMRCAGVMGAKSALYAFSGNTEAKSRVDRNGRAFVTAATVYAQPLGLTEQQLSEAFAASTARALGAVTQTRDPAATDAAMHQLNREHDACIALARGWVAEANGTS